MIKNLFTTLEYPITAFVLVLSLAIGAHHVTHRNEGQLLGIETKSPQYAQCFEKICGDKLATRGQCGDIQIDCQIQ